MRIAVVGPTYPFRGGIAHHTTLMVRALRQKHQVDFYSFSSQYPRWLFPGKTDRDPSDNPIREQCEYSMDLFNPLSWLATGRQINVHQVDLLILPWWVPVWAPAWMTLSWMARRKQNTRTLFLCHNVLPHDRHWWDRPITRAALGSGDAFITHSQQEAGLLRGLLPEKPAEVTPHPTYRHLGTPQNQNPTAREKFGLPADRPVLLFFGFVRPYKGLDTLIEAMPAIVQETGAHLLIAGEFWKDKTPYVKQIEELNVQESVTIVDEYIPNEALAAIFDPADVVVLPYRSATQSGVIQLAFGFGKPVITTRVGGMAEVVSDGVTGLVVQPENPVDLATAVKRFFAEQLAESMTANLASEAGRFSWEHLVSTIEKLAAETSPAARSASSEGAK